MPDVAALARAHQSQSHATQGPHAASYVHRCRAQPELINATVLEWGRASDPGGGALEAGMRQALAGLPTAS